MAGFVNVNRRIHTANHERLGLSRVAVNTDFAVGEGSLDSTLTLYLYNWDSVVPGFLQPAVYTLDKGADASTDYFAAITVSSAPAVPVPAAVWLLGSGLISVIGLRRKNG